MGALGDGQTSDEYTVSICAKDSSGPFNYDLRKKIVSLAKENKIPYQVDIYPYYGSDAAAALRTGVDAKHILFGPGIDASHSYERVHQTSINATTDLIIKYLISK
jgi:putative aminopeptidase FrvX